MTKEDFDKVYTVNVLGVFNAAQAAARLWVDNKYQGGSMVIISSMSSQIINQVGQGKPLTQVWRSVLLRKESCSTLRDRYFTTLPRPRCPIS